MHKFIFIISHYLYLLHCTNQFQTFMPGVQLIFEKSFKTITCDAFELFLFCAKIQKKNLIPTVNSIFVFVKYTLNLRKHLNTTHNCRKIKVFFNLIDLI